MAFFRHLAGQRPGGIANRASCTARLLRQNPDLDTPFFRELGAVLDDRKALLAGWRVLADDSGNAGAYPAYVALNLADALGDADLWSRRCAASSRSAPATRRAARRAISLRRLLERTPPTLRTHPDFAALLLQAGVVDYWRQTGRLGDGCAPLGTGGSPCR